jgi:hypothetical protein
VLGLVADSVSSWCASQHLSTAEALKLQKKHQTSRAALEVSQISKVDLYCNLKIRIMCRRSDVTLESSLQPLVE